MVKVHLQKSCPVMESLNLKIWVHLLSEHFSLAQNPVLTEGAGAQSWASNFPGQLDQFRFYDRAISASDIKQLYSGKE